MMKIYDTVSEAYKRPKLIRLTNNLYVLSFHVMKLLPAIHILEKAVKENKVDQKTLIVETSSGSFAYGIGLACTELNLRFKIVSDSPMDPLLKGQLFNQNGEVCFVHKGENKSGVQQARLDKLYQIIEEESSSYWTCQYDNLSNGDAYTELGSELAETLGDDLMLVGPVGSGGSTSGLISAIREKRDLATLVGVDTFNSVLFGQDDGPRLLVGLGNSIMPKNLIHERFDQVHWVSADEAFHSTLQLHKQYGLFCGPTTGAAYPVAQWLAAENPRRNVVFISPDTGHRYSESVYNQEWIEEKGFCRGNYPSKPKEVRNPKEAHNSWSFQHWNRQTLLDALKN